MRGSPPQKPYARAAHRAEARSRAQLFDGVFAAVCHHLPERTLRLAGVVMPLCSRCSGIFAGAAAGALVARPALSPHACRAWLLAASLCMVVDVLAQAVGLSQGGHATRLATGFAFGYALAVGLLAPRTALPSSLDASPRVSPPLRLGRPLGRPVRPPRPTHSRPP